MVSMYGKNICLPKMPVLWMPTVEMEKSGGGQFIGVGDLPER